MTIEGRYCERHQIQISLLGQTKSVLKKTKGKLTKDPIFPASLVASSGGSNFQVLRMCMQWCIKICWWQSAVNSTGAIKFSHDGHRVRVGHKSNYLKIKNIYCSFKIATLLEQIWVFFQQNTNRKATFSQDDVGLRLCVNPALHIFGAHLREPAQGLGAWSLVHATNGTMELGVFSLPPNHGMLCRYKMFTLKDC